MRAALSLLTTLTTLTNLAGMADGTRLNVVVDEKLHRAARVRMAATGESWEALIGRLLSEWLGKGEGK